MTSQPHDRLPHEPFDTDEAALARAYRALPGGEPSPGLDARILAQARAAVGAETSTRRRKPWFLGAGLGAAAAAVMAAGIAWQVGWLERARESARTQAPAASMQRENVDAAASAPPAESLDRIEVDYMRQERKAEAPAAEASALAPPSDAQPARLREQRATPAPAPPPPPAPQQAAQNAVPSPAPVVVSEPQPFLEESAPAADVALSAAANSELERADAGSASTQEAPMEYGLSASRAAAAKPRAALPPWAEDAGLEADAWLERIRERVRNGDRQGAEHSLRRFVLRHPTRAVPQELQRLLVE